MYRDPRHRDAFVATLPIAGKDGTISTRMQRTRAEGNAVAKTGSISNVRALSGLRAHARRRDAGVLDPRQRLRDPVGHRQLDCRPRRSRRWRTSRGSDVVGGYGGTDSHGGTGFTEAARRRVWARAARSAMLDPWSAPSRQHPRPGFSSTKSRLASRCRPQVGTTRGARPHVVSVATFATATEPLQQPTHRRNLERHGGPGRRTLVVEAHPLLPKAVTARVPVVK